MHDLTPALTAVASERRFSVTLESIGDGVICTDERGRVERMNHVALRLTGWTLEAARGRAMDEVLHIIDEDLDAVVPSRLDEVMRTGFTVGLPLHTALVRRDGSRCAIADSIAPIVARDGTRLGVVVVFRDLTNQRLLERQLHELAERVESSREEERTRIAHELHDELGQQLTAMQLDLAWLSPRLADVPEPVGARLKALSGVLDSTFAMVRRLGTELRPRILDDLGLEAAVEWLSTELEERSDLHVTVAFDADLPAQSNARSTAMFRIFQEGLTNVVRHAEATTVELRLSSDPSGRLTLSITDDGKGLPETKKGPPAGLGLVGMKERAALSGGTFRIEPGPAGGTVITVTLPPLPKAPVVSP
jgi:PAS domain S-box-containing protein